MKKEAIKSDGTKKQGKKIIDYFIQKNAVNPVALDGASFIFPFYYIDKFNKINFSQRLPKGYKLIKLKLPKRHKLISLK